MRRVLHIPQQDIEPVQLRREGGGNGRVLPPAPARDQRRAAGRIGLDHRCHPMVAEKAADLAQRHGMAMHPPDIAEARARHPEQAVLDPLEMLADDGEAAFRQQRMDIRHAAGEAVFAGQHGEAGPALAHCFDGGLEGLAGQGGHVRKRGAAGEVGIGARHALECDRARRHASTLRARSRSSGVSTPKGAALACATPMRMPASSTRNCSRLSRISSGDSGRETKRSSAARRNA